MHPLRLHRLTSEREPAGTLLLPMDKGLEQGQIGSLMTALGMARRIPEAIQGHGG